MPAPLTPTPTNRTYGWMLILAPLLLLVATLSYVAAGSFYESKEGGAVQLVAMALLAVGVVGLTRLVEPDFPRVAAVLSVVGGLGAVAGAGFGIERIYTGIGAETLESVTVGAASLYPMGILFPLSMIGFGLALARGRTALYGNWAGWALVAGGVLFPVTRIGNIVSLALIADSLLAIGLITIGWSLTGVSSTAGSKTLAGAGSA